MKILVTGGSGLIGYKLVKQLVNSGHEVYFTYLTHQVPFKNASAFKLDVADMESTIKLLKKIKPEITIHTVAIANVDLCETNHELADKINVEGTRNVVNGCKEIKSKVVYISTSAVFDGNKETYAEGDTTNPAYYYAKTKFEGENIVKNSGLPFLILRTDQPYCWLESWQKEKTSVLRVLKKLEAGDETFEFTDWYNNPTFVDNFAEVALKLLERNKTGIYHVTGPDFLNRYELAIKVSEVFGKDKKLIRSTTSDTLNLPAKRVNANLSNKKAQDDSGIKLLGIDDGLNAMLKQKRSSSTL